MPATLTASTMFPETLAHVHAASMQAHEEEGWTYRVEVIDLPDASAPASATYAVIAVFDETNTFVGYF